MSKYIGKRLLMMIPVLLGVMIIVFTINFLTPGEPARMILGDGATPEALAQVTEELGLNDPYLVQLGRYIGNVVFKLNLGESYDGQAGIRGDCLPLSHNSEAGHIQRVHLGTGGRIRGNYFRYEAVLDF